ncbi:MAG TPA: hypothetical protein VKR42_06700 [Ktedonobacteraceae bacterium]|nr:hypothetical protein [Ktedonobacteraceae bacterium]
MSDKQKSVAAAVNTNIHEPEDDIDTIFLYLQRVEPPQSLIARILTQIPQQSSATCFFTPPLRESEIHSWAIRSKQRNVC